MTQIKSICVYCASNFGDDDVFKHEARALGTALARKKMTLVYGGTTVGLMGELASAALQEGGTVVGVITDLLNRKGLSHQGLSRLVVTDTMSQRKSAMRELADGFVAMAGGIGTLEEALETLTLNQLGEHKKPVGVLDTKGFYAGLHALLDTMVNNKFLKIENRKALIVESHVETLITKLESYQHHHVDKWF